MGSKISKFRRKPEKGKENEAAAVASSSAAPPPPWIDLPEDITADILKRLGDKEILETAPMVCTTWRKVCQDPSVWRVIYWKNTRRYDSVWRLIFWRNADRYDAAMCRNAVDRSQGQLVDLSISYFLNDDFMNYIADRASHLRHLRIEHCLNISSRAFTQSLKKLPYLEELHLYCVPYFEAALIESIGISCPMLKSFTLRHSYRHLRCRGYETLVATCTHAFAVAKTMPNLVHLRLVGLWIKNDGLEAILDACPRLESLDLRRCYHLDLSGELGNRCLEQVKHVRDVDEELSDSDEFYGDISRHDGIFRDHEIDRHIRQVHRMMRHWDHRFQRR